MRIVHSLDELLSVAQDRKVNGFHARQPVRLEIPALTRPALYRSQAALNCLQSRCGSAVGAALMFAGLLAGVLVVFDRHGATMTWPVFNECGVVLAVSFVLGFLGKLATLAFTRWQFARRCRAQHQVLSSLLPR